ncbi:type VII secretion-associated protein [Rhodococcus sp. NPDC003322]
MTARQGAQRQPTAVHLTETRVWARHDDRTVERPAGVMIDAAGLVVGVDRATAVGDDVFEPAPIRYIDDEVLLLGTTTVPVREVLAALLAYVAAAVGASTPVDVLVLTCPTGWATRRRRVLAAAGRAVAGEVRVIAAADAVDRVLDDDGIVIEVGMLSSTASSTEDDAGVSVDTVGSMDLSERLDAAAELVSAVHAWQPEAPARVAITGELSASRAATLAAEVSRAWGALPRVREVRGAAVVDGAYSWALDLLGHRAPDPEPEPRPRRRLPRAIVAGALLAAVAAAAVAWNLGRSDPEGTAAVGPAVEVWAASGRAAITVPAGWVERTPASRPDRVELVRVDGRPARILLVHKELNPGADLDAVAGTLAARIAERADTFGPLERVDVGSRPALSYREFPDPDSQVRWQVFVTDGLQVSLGCQAPRDRLPDLEPQCDDVARSVTVAPR